MSVERLEFHDAALGISVFTLDYDPSGDDRAEHYGSNPTVRLRVETHFGVRDLLLSPGEHLIRHIPPHYGVYPLTDSALVALSGLYYLVSKQGEVKLFDAEDLYETAFRARPENRYALAAGLYEAVLFRGYTDLVRIVPPEGTHYIEITNATATQAELELSVYDRTKLGVLDIATGHLTY